ncbi:hypothetical protein ACFTAO_36510 [Paenibacillus rhizoplanae]
MVLLRLAVPGRQAGDTVEMEELAAEHEVFVNWNREFQFRHDQWWDPLCPSRVHLDTAGLITTFFDGCQTMDDRSCFNWRTYDGDGRICSAEAGAVSAPQE